MGDLEIGQVLWLKVRYQIDVVSTVNHPMVIADIKNDYIEQYYDVKKYVTDRLGNSIPTFVITTESQQDINAAVKNMMDYIDNKFTAISNKQEISLNQLEMSVTESQSELMKKFLLQSSNSQLNNDKAADNEDDYETFIGGFKA